MAAVTGTLGPERLQPTPAVNPSRDWRSGVGAPETRQTGTGYIAYWSRLVLLLERKIGLAQGHHHRWPVTGRTASNCLFGNNQPHPSFDLHHLERLLMFRTILICMTLTMTVGAAEAANASLRGPYRRESKPLRKRQLKLVAIET